MLWEEKLAQLYKEIRCVDACEKFFEPRPSLVSGRILMSLFLCEGKSQINPRSFKDQRLNQVFKKLSRSSFKNLFYRGLRWSGLLLVGIYRNFFAGFLGGACRFSPSCSCYAQEAFLKHEPVRAIKLTASRLAKCRPGGPFGFDPVPDGGKSAR